MNRWAILCRPSGTKTVVPIVEVDGRNLADLLVEDGRLHGTSVTLPDGTKIAPYGTIRQAMSLQGPAPRGPRARMRK